MQTCVCVRQGIPLNPSGLSPAPCFRMASQGAAMASFHLAVKTVSRSTGRSATGAAAYRAGAEITDERTGLIHDYTRKQGVEHSAIILPANAPAWSADRARLWNAAEQAETRKNSTVAREFEIALPSELDADGRRDLAMTFAQEISERHGVAVDVSIHAPHRHGDDRNHHAHLLVTTRQLGPEGLGAKTRELDQKQSGEVERWRARWADMQNVALERAGSGERVDHRSYERRGIAAEPELKQGPAITAMERRAEQQAAREGVSYEPVTEVGAHNAALKEKRGLRQIIERGTAWLRSHGVDLDRIKQTAAERVRALKERLAGPAPALATPARSPTLSPAAERVRSAEPPARDRASSPEQTAAERIRAKLESLPDRLREIQREKDLDRDRQRDRDRDKDKDRGGPGR